MASKQPRRPKMRLQVKSGATIYYMTKFQDILVSQNSWLQWNPHFCVTQSSKKCTKQGLLTCVAIAAGNYYDNFQLLQIRNLTWLEYLSHGSDQIKFKLRGFPWLDLMRALHSNSQHVRERAYELRVMTCRSLPRPIAMCPNFNRRRLFGRHIIFGGRTG